MALRWCWLSCLRWPNRQYVVIRACLNLNVPLLGIRCTMTQSQLHTRLLHYIGIDDIRLCTDVDYIYGFGRAGSTCIFEFECLVTWYAAYDALWYHHNCIFVCYSTTMAMEHGRFFLVLIKCMQLCQGYFEKTGSTFVLVHNWIWICRWSRCIARFRIYLNPWNGVVYPCMLALDEKGVRWYWCMF